jgi:hypothetical protein
LYYNLVIPVLEPMTAHVEELTESNKKFAGKGFAKEATEPKGDAALMERLQRLEKQVLAQEAKEVEVV